MLRLTLFGLVASTLVPVFALQAPFNSGHAENQAVFEDENFIDWNLENLEKLPNPNDTHHLVFETVHSLLQHWPNTRMRNGHNIIPCIVPKGTLLYHGGNTTELPQGPEWVSTDPEHSYLFCHGLSLFPEPQFQQHDRCWQLSLATTRPLKVVYFDGSSAAKMPYGSMDTQDLLAWGEAQPEVIWNEFQVAKDLCAWGKDLGVDGFVRMEMDFEIILCDFTSGVSVVSQANLISVKPNLPFWPLFAPFEVMSSGSWHNRFPGETRIRLDLAGLVSFYDTKLVPSLVTARAGQERWDHRVRDISNEDMSAVKSRLEASLIGPSGLSSGIDWMTLIRVVVDRFAGRLESTRYLLNSTATSPNELLNIANKTQTQLRIMLTPYLLASAVPTDPSDKTDLDWAKPIYRLCATIHTEFMDSELDFMTDSERLLLRAVRGTTREICRVVAKMWAAGVYAGIDSLVNTKQSPDIAEVALVWDNWIRDLNRLMAWLDWSVWVKCNPDCGSEEMCYLPTWPIGFPYPPMTPANSAGGVTDTSTLKKGHSSFELRAMALEKFAKEMSDAVKPGREEWSRPKPRCVRRFDPYEF